jgi:hypothetical protein
LRRFDTSLSLISNLERPDSRRFILTRTPYHPFMPTSSEQYAQHLIAGMPRAATTWLCKCLNEHPEVAAWGESLYWGRNFVEPRGDRGRYTPLQVDEILSRLSSGECLNAVAGDEPGCLRIVRRETFASLIETVRATLPPNPTPGELFASVGHAIARAEGKSISVEKTPHHLNWLDRIARELPESRVILMLREPYSFMLSYKHQGDRKREFVRKQFERRYHPLACALVWRGCVQAAQAASVNYPDHLLLVRQEDVRDNASDVLDRVQEFLTLRTRVPGAELASRIPQDNTSFPGEKRPTLESDDIFWMNLIAGETIARAHYQRRPTPIDPVRIAWSIVRLPIWAIWNLFSLKRRVRGSIVLYLWRWIRPSRTQPAAGAHA